MGRIDHRNLRSRNSSRFICDHHVSSKCIQTTPRSSLSVHIHCCLHGKASHRWTIPMICSFSQLTFIDMIIYYSLVLNGHSYVRWSRPLRVLFPFALQAGQSVGSKRVASIHGRLFSFRFVGWFEIFFEHYRISPMWCFCSYCHSWRSLCWVLEFWKTSKISFVRLLIVLLFAFRIGNCTIRMEMIISRIIWIQPGSCTSWRRQRTIRMWCKERRVPVERSIGHLDWPRMPAFNNSILYVIFFVAYLLVNLYLFMNLLLAVIFSNYKQHLQVSDCSSQPRLHPRPLVD